MEIDKVKAELKQVGKRVADLSQSITNEEQTKMPSSCHSSKCLDMIFSTLLSLSQSSLPM